MNNFNQEKLIFIVGMPRSGTTLLRLIMAAHPEICSPHETAFTTDLYFPYLMAKKLKFGKKYLLRRLKKVPGFSNWNLNDNDLSTVINTNFETYQKLLLGLYGLYVAQNKKAYFVDKYPDNVFRLKFIRRFFPRAKIIHIYRDPRDVAASWKESSQYLFADVKEVARRWSLAMRRTSGLMQADTHYLEIAYEEMVSNPKKTLLSVCKFIEISFSEKMCEHNKYVQAKDLFPAATIKNKKLELSAITKSRISRYKKILTTSEEQGIEAVASQEMLEKGYSYKSSISATAGKTLLVSRIKRLLSRSGLSNVIRSFKQLCQAYLLGEASMVSWRNFWESGSFFD